MKNIEEDWLNQSLMYKIPELEKKLRLCVNITDFYKENRWKYPKASQNGRQKWP